VAMLVAPRPKPVESQTGEAAPRFICSQISMTEIVLLGETVVGSPPAASLETAVQHRTKPGALRAPPIRGFFMAATELGFRPTVEVMSSIWNISIKLQLLQPYPAPHKSTLATPHAQASIILENMPRSESISVDGGEDTSRRRIVT